MPNSNNVDLSLNVGRVMYGKKNGVDIGDLENGPVSSMFLDPVKLGQAVWAVYQDRLTDAGYATDQKLFDLMDSKMTRQFEEAMKKALSDFFSWGRPLVEQIEKKIGKITALMDNVENQASGQSSGDQPESLDSTHLT